MMLNFRSSGFVTQKSFTMSQFLFIFFRWNNFSWINSSAHKSERFRKVEDK